MSSSFGKNVSVVIAATVMPILIAMMGRLIVKWILLYLVPVGVLVYFERRRSSLHARRVLITKPVSF